ncbi:MAG: DUF2924 domain-containing protein [Proteobacteria bacterium]|nr:DUF2924 domain-containing protein [Pseudomonadota bacterium]
MGRDSTSNTLEREIGTLADLPRADLVERWKVLYRPDPPKGISTRLMVRAIAYEMQARQYGGLKSAIVRQLDKIAGSKSDGGAKCAPWVLALDPGVRLVREWNGVTHTVDVTDDGFEWQDQQYGSLSEIAREITGARWSGPRFFGLNGRAKP